jgi:chemotaxis protein methyltransferase CheR
LPHDVPAKIERGSLTRLMDKVLEERGLDLAQYRQSYVERRVAVRLNNLGIRSYAQYANHLNAHPEEYAALLDAMTINVTQFFRDPTVFDLVRNQVVRELLQTKKERRQRLVRVWSAGCATGEETYSLTMTFLDGMQRWKADDSVLTVIGTDIDRDALATAKRGEYRIAAAAHIPRIDRVRFIETHDDTFRIKPEVTKHVRFQYLNLFSDPPIHGIDVIFCRNVFIYFNRQDQDRLIRAFRTSLVRGGYLVLGRSERLAPALAREFELISSRERIYRKPVSLL